MTASTLRVSELYVYPVKSLRGLRIARSPLTRQGFRYDRRWMLVDEDGTFLTQRQLPELCRIETALLSDGIRLSAPGQPDFLLPLAHEDGDEQPVRVWRHQGTAARHAPGSAWLSAVLGRACSLVYMAERHERPVAPGLARPDDRVSFADGFPFLLIGQASLDDLNARLQSPLSMRRFRPNIVVTGGAPFAEDHWTELSIGSVGFRGVKRCERCVVTTLDPDSGEGGKEPLRTLSTYRRVDGKVWFGMNLIHDGLGTLSEGDAVTFSSVQPTA